MKYLNLSNEGIGKFLSLKVLITLSALFIFSSASYAVPPTWVSFEDDETPPFYGFTAGDRGGSYGMTADINRDVTPTIPILFGDYAAYLSDSWERVTLPIDITEGLVQVWFYDDNYGGGTPGTQTSANALRLRSEEDDPARDPGWPLYYLAVDLKGEYTGHGRSGFMEYYTIAKNDDPNAGMGVQFGYPVGSVNDEVMRATETWHLVSFDIDNGITTLSVDREMVDIVETHTLSELELLCRSGWYQTRPGEEKIMRWDGIAINPKMHSTDFSSTPSWMTFAGSSSLVFDITRESQTVPFEFIPGCSRVARFSEGNQSMSCSWNATEGSIEIWYWDNISDEGGNPDNGSIDIIVSSAADAGVYTRMRTYESVMGSLTDKWYLVSPQSPSGMGNSYNLPRQHGWNKMVFHKMDGCLYVSLNSELVSSYDYRWDSPPDDLVLEIVSRDGYNDGFPLWLGRIVMTGTSTSAVNNWNLYY